MKNIQGQVINSSIPASANNCNLFFRPSWWHRDKCNINKGNNSLMNPHSNGLPSPPHRTTFFKFCWWNGGGKIKFRLKSNPALRNFLKIKPDIFAYGESETPSPLGLGVNGYACYVHKSKLSVIDNYRRGLAIFYLIKYQFLLTKVYSSKIYDIVWMRLNISDEPLFFCFFYSPGSHHPLPVRTKFYDELSSSYSKFAQLGKVYLTGDTNARLGHILNDRNVRGKLTINPNQPLLLGFLKYSGVTILNSKFCKGVPTYEIVNKKRSIIDLSLTNSPKSVQSFKVEPTPFGVNCQTCHRALTTTLKLSPPDKPATTATRRNVTRIVTAKEMDHIAATVTRQILTSGSSADYNALLKMFSQVKGNITRKRRKISRYKTNKSPTMQNLERRFSNATKTLLREKSEFALFAVENLEKLLNSQYEKEEKEKTSMWLKKMNNLDFLNCTRTFFLELRNKHKVRENFVPIIDSVGTISKNIDETLKNWAEYYKKQYFCSDEVVRFDTPHNENF